MNGIMQRIMVFGVTLIVLLTAALDFQKNSAAVLERNAQRLTAFAQSEAKCSILQVDVCMLRWNDLHILSVL